MAGGLGNAASVRTDTADEERDLIVRVQRGDKHAFDELARRYARRAFAVAYRILRHTQDAEDLVQDAFVAALDGIGSFDPSRPFAPWFFKIVVNRALNAASARSTRERHVSVIQLWTSDAVAIDSSVFAAAVDSCTVAHSRYQTSHAPASTASSPAQPRAISGSTNKT